MSAIAHLHDERATPPLRAVLGTLLGAASRADLAVARVRLFGIDLDRGEVGRLRRCRLLLGRLDAASLDGGGDTVPDALACARLEALRLLVASGTALVRAAGAQSWDPDFSVYHGLTCGPATPHGTACLVGAHYFGQPLAGPGVALTCLLTSRAAVARAAARFEELWERGHDAGPAVLETIDALLA